MNTFTSFLALVRKEHLELWRDQRSLLATFAYALLGPLLLYVLINGFIATATEQTTVIIGLQNQSQYSQAIEEVNHFLGTQNIETIRFNGDLPESFKSTDSEPADFDVLIKISQPHNAARSDAADSEDYIIEIYGDRSTEDSSKRLSMASTLINLFVTQNQQNTLLKQGIMPSDNSWSVRSHVVNEQTVRTNKLMDSLLVFLLLAPFFITLNYINDATAGERERGSLMPILTQPIDRGLLVLSKWGVGSVLGIVGTIVTMLIGFKLIAGLPIYEIGLSLDASVKNMALTVAIVTPLALLVTSLQMWIALTAKNFKEGQSYLTLFSFIPLIAVFMAAEFEGISWSGIMPLIGHQQMLKEVFTLQSFNYQQFMSLSAVCVCIAALALMAVKQKLNSESILQGR